jgi:hypothetical protein
MPPPLAGLRVLPEDPEVVLELLAFVLALPLVVELVLLVTTFCPAWSPERISVWVPTMRPVFTVT